MTYENGAGYGIRSGKVRKGTLCRCMACDVYIPDYRDEYFSEDLVLYGPYCKSCYEYEMRE